MSNSPAGETPRTKALDLSQSNRADRRIGTPYSQMMLHAEQLERELAAAQRALEQMREVVSEIAPAETDVGSIRVMADAALNGRLLGNQKECIAMHLQDYARFIRLARAKLAK